MKCLTLVSTDSDFSDFGLCSRLLNYNIWQLESKFWSFTKLSMTLDYKIIISPAAADHRCQSLHPLWRWLHSRGFSL